MSPLILITLTATTIFGSISSLYFFIVFFFLHDLEKKVKRRLQKIYGQNELKSKIEMMSHRALFDKKRLKAAPIDNSFRHMIFAGKPSTRKPMAARSLAGNNNSI